MADQELTAREEIALVIYEHIDTAPRKQRLQAAVAALAVITRRLRAAAEHRRAVCLDERAAKVLGQMAEELER